MLRWLFCRKEPDWSPWRTVLVRDHNGDMVEAQQRHNYDTLTMQTLVDDIVWTATLEQQREHVEDERREMGL